jgi:hypothetical protein
MDAADLELFDRSVRAATEASDVDAALDDLGWQEALAFEPAVAVSALFRAQGEANSTSAALGHVLRHALSVDAAVLVPPLGSWAPPGDTVGLTTGAPEHLVVVRHAGDKYVAAVVPTDRLTLRPVGGLDPSLELVEVSGESPDGTDLGPVDWDSAVALAQLALAHELLGASRRMLELAREHALERVQFGQPIAKFQAVRHRLAETLVAIETAEAVVDAAWIDGSPGTAAMAKALAGRGSRTAARHCQQVLAGIGFTTEHPLHSYIRRVFVLDELFGAARTLTRGLGEELLRTRRLPGLLPL